MAARKKADETALVSAQETREAPEVSQEQAEGVPPATEEAVGLYECFVIPANGLRLREAPDFGARVIAVLPGGSGVWTEHSPEGVEWAKVQTGILSGYVRAEHLELMPCQELEASDAGAE